MDLHQIQLKYSTEEDRLLLRVSFRDEQGALQEVRAWLTRRFLATLWPTLIETMRSQVVMGQPGAAHASAEMVGMEHETSLSRIRESGGFDTPYETAAAGLPLGEAPILVTTANLSVPAGDVLRIEFVAPEQGSFEVSLTSTMLHGFCELVQEAMAEADWRLDLAMPAVGAPATGTRLLN